MCDKDISFLVIGVRNNLARIPVYRNKHATLAGIIDNAPRSSKPHAGVNAFHNSIPFK